MILMLTQTINLLTLPNKRLVSPTSRFMIAGNLFTNIYCGRLLTLVLRGPAMWPAISFFILLSGAYCISTFADDDTPLSDTIIGLRDKLLSFGNHAPLYGLPASARTKVYRDVDVNPPEFLPYLSLAGPRQRTILASDLVNEYQPKFVVKALMASNTLSMPGFDLVALLSLDSITANIYNLNTLSPVMTLPLSAPASSLVLLANNDTHAGLLVNCGTKGDSINIIDLDLEVLQYKTNWLSRISRRKAFDYIGYGANSSHTVEYYEILSSNGLNIVTNDLKHVPCFDTSSSDSYPAGLSCIFSLDDLIVLKTLDVSGSDTIEVSSRMFAAQEAKVVLLNIGADQLLVVSDAVSDSVQFYSIQNGELVGILDNSEAIGYLCSIKPPLLSDDLLAVFGPRTLKIYSVFHDTCDFNGHRFEFRLVSTRDLQPESLPIRAASSFVKDSQSIGLVYLGSDDQLFSIIVPLEAGAAEDCFKSSLIGINQIQHDVRKWGKDNSLLEKQVLKDLEGAVEFGENLSIKSGSFYSIELLHSPFVFSSGDIIAAAETTWRSPILSLSDIRDIVEKLTIVENFSEIATNFSDVAYRDRDETFNQPVKFISSTISEINCSCSTLDKIGSTQLTYFIGHLVRRNQIFGDDIHNKVFRNTVNITDLVAPGIIGGSGFATSADGGSVIEGPISIDTFDSESVFVDKMANISLDSLINLVDNVSVYSLAKIRTTEATLTSPSIASIDSLELNGSVYLQYDTDQTLDRAFFDSISVYNLTAPTLYKELSNVIRGDQLNTFDSLRFENLCVSAASVNYINQLRVPSDFLTINSPQEFDFSFALIRKASFDSLYLHSTINSLYYYSDFATITQVETLGPVDIFGFDALDPYSIRVTGDVCGVPIWNWYDMFKEVVNELVEIKVSISNGLFPNNSVNIQNLNAHSIIFRDQDLLPLVDDVLNMGYLKNSNVYSEHCILESINNVSLSNLLLMTGGPIEADLTFSSLFIDHLTTSCKPQSKFSALHALMDDIAVESGDFKGSREDNPIDYVEISDLASKKFLGVDAHDLLTEHSDISVDDLSVLSLDVKNLEIHKSSNLNGFGGGVFENVIRVDDVSPTLLNVDLADVSVDDLVAKDDFVGIKAHELNTTLGTILVADDPRRIIANDISLDDLYVNDIIIDGDGDYYVDSAEFGSLFTADGLVSHQISNASFCTDLDDCGTLTFPGLVILGNLVATNISVEFGSDEQKVLEKATWNILLNSGSQLISTRFEACCVDFGSITTDVLFGHMDVVEAPKCTLQQLAEGELIAIMSDATLNFTSGLDVKHFSNIIGDLSHTGIPLDDLAWLNSSVHGVPYLKYSTNLKHCDFESDLNAYHILSNNTINGFDIIKLADEMNYTRPISV